MKLKDIIAVHKVRQVILQDTTTKDLIILRDWIQGTEASVTDTKNHYSVTYTILFKLPGWHSPFKAKISYSTKSGLYSLCCGDSIGLVGITSMRTVLLEFEKELLKL